MYLLHANAIVEAVLLFFMYLSTCCSIQHDFKDKLNKHMFHYIRIMNNVLK